MTDRITAEQLAKLKEAHAAFFDRGITSGRLPELLNAIPALIAAAGERDAAFSAGKRAGIEAAAAIFDRHASDIEKSLSGLRPDGQAYTELSREHVRTIADAKSIRALIEEPKEKTDG
jgi:hypothetical protein